jgi:hypothetical protein
MGDEWGGPEIVIADPPRMPWRHRALLRVLDVLAGWLHRSGRPMPPPHAKKPPRAP